MDLKLKGKKVLMVLVYSLITFRSRRLLEARAQEKWGIPDVWERDLKDLPFSRTATPGEIGDFITFCCSPVASYLSGTCINLDSGKTFK